MIYLSSLIIVFKWLQEIWLGPGVDKLSHLLIALINSTLVKWGYSMFGCNGTSSKSQRFIGLFWAIL